MRPDPGFMCKRVLYNGSWTFSTASTAGFWRYNAITTGQINNFTELAALFDEYKICGVKFTYRPRYDNVDAASATTSPQGYALINIDPTSEIVVTGAYSAATENGFLEQAVNVRTKSLSRPFSIYYRPKISDTVTSGNAYQNAPWLSVTSTATLHRGFHMFLHVNNLSTSSTNLVLDEFITVYVRMRGRK